MDAVYCKLGITEASDLIAAAKSLSTTDYVDADRIGIYGWSYGGYEALMCATAPQSPFKATVAVAPVTDWRYYDTAYTERYMRTPQQNETGYDTSAPLNRIDNLNGNLLMMWGTLDDNVHPANSLEFISRMQMRGKYPQILIFPNQNHSINGCELREVVYSRMLDFFDSNM
jgi:dipeptidyl-peptidase IV